MAVKSRRDLTKRGKDYEQRVARQERSERRHLGWIDDFAGKREARVSRLDFEAKPLDPTSIVKSLGR